MKYVAEENMQRIKFNFEINFGHILIISGLLVQGVVYTTAIRGDLAETKQQVKQNTKDIEHHQFLIDRITDTQASLSRTQALLEERMNNKKVN